MSKDSAALRRFTRDLLTDLQALEHMIDTGMIEEGVRRIGAEQELFLVDSKMRPAPIFQEMLDEIADPHFTTELGRFNLEFNLDPLPWGGDCLRLLEQQIEHYLAMSREAAAKIGANVAITGILPTLEQSDLILDNMTPKDRYYALNDAMYRLRGSHFHVHIKGRDEIRTTHDNVLLEACNTSFQVHFQVAPAEFAHLYNIAQTVAGPVLAAAVNSPLLFGRYLWGETRIALFQQSVDTRPTSHIRDMSPRVRFGDRWVDDSVLEIFREDILRFRVLLGTEIDERPFTELASGQVPSLSALCMHNGTIYRWMRPCFGVLDGKPHLRIENRILPSGPSPLDEVANAAFWFGLMSALAEEYDDITKVISFESVLENFAVAARRGLGAQFTWLGRRKHHTARDLIRNELLPLARAGLEGADIDQDDIERYLGVIDHRVASGKTGARWLVESCAVMEGCATRTERRAALVAAMIDREQSGQPAHEWDLAQVEEAGGWTDHYVTVGQFMTTDLFTVNGDELVDLVAAMMVWRGIRHVPVEDNQHHLIGLVTARGLVRSLFKRADDLRADLVPVSEIMHDNLVLATPDMSTCEAIRLMREHRIGCLPVVEHDRLVGIITEADFMIVAGQLLEDFLRQLPGKHLPEAESGAARPCRDPHHCSN